ncbi:dihydropteroate synthase [Salimicrobium humidisoli]|uniref:Dihydropteroate synthase n=1 Tax=Salimicrobium humidisoli TaxID=2029857 RepID=A0ABX4HNW4_9BACI|nr:dihydropteroate synthase [Salimicrobium humidisoli]PBB04897.1 dihydropteroate synthase [Salimicrobium humidisoli]
MNNIRIGRRTYDLDEETLVMGILNVTPDSFSDGGRFNDVSRAVEHAGQMVADGASIIDIGGESTRPGHEPVSEQEEIERIVPIIREVRKEVSVPISIDTYKAEVARQAIEAGADIINDVWGAKRDPRIAEVAATCGVPIILMHNREERNYSSLIEDMKADLLESVEIARGKGVPESDIILDPGIGFAKTMQDNMVAMRHLKEFKELGYPLLLGSSRKRFIGTVLNTETEDRMEGTGATVCFGITQGVGIVRVHDVKEIVRMTKMMDAMMGRGEWNG